MKAFISVDMEGIPHVVSREHLLPGKSLYHEARELMTECLNAVVKALGEKGVEEAVVADSHGPMVNVIPEKLPGNVSLIRGYPRSQAMIAGSEGCDFAIFLGYHAKTGTPKAIFDHVYSGAVLRSLRINGLEASEYLLNAATLGENGIPLIMVAGDKALIEGDVAKHTAWAIGVVLKESLGRYSARSPAPSRALGALIEGAQRALDIYREGKAKPLLISPPLTVDVEFQNTAYAEIASHLPNSTSIEGVTVRFEGKSMGEVYKVLELLVMAAHGVRSIAEA